MAEPYATLINLVSDYIRRLLFPRPDGLWSGIRIVGAATKQRNEIVENETKRLTSLLTGLHPSLTIDWPLPTLHEDIADFVKDELLAQGYHVHSSENGKLTISLIPPKMENLTRPNRVVTGDGSVVDNPLRKFSAVNLQDLINNYTNQEIPKNEEKEGEEDKEKEENKKDEVSDDFVDVK